MALGFWIAVAVWALLMLAWVEFFDHAGRRNRRFNQALEAGLRRRAPTTSTRNENATRIAADDRAA